MRFALLFSILLLVSCAGAAPSPAAPVGLRISGSSSMTPALRDIASAYRAGRPNVQIDVLGNGSQTGLRELRSGVVDIAALSWLPDDARLPAGFQARPVALDAIAIIVHPRNKITGLSLAQARSLYRGEVLDWQALGGPAGEPTIISREEGSGTRAAFETEVMAGESVTLNAQVMPSAQAVVQTISRRADAIGYVSTAVLVTQPAPSATSAFTATVRVVRVEDLLPTPDNVRSGGYRLQHYVYLVTADPPSADVTRFLEFVSSSEGQAIIGRYHVALP